jgi:hypothetical protein
MMILGMMIHFSLMSVMVASYFHFDDIDTYQKKIMGSMLYMVTNTKKVRIIFTHANET